jgi:hypothetical protein
MLVAMNSLIVMSFKKDDKYINKMINSVKTGFGKLNRY